MLRRSSAIQFFQLFNLNASIAAIFSLVHLRYMDHADCKLSPVDLESTNFGKTAIHNLDLGVYFR